MAANLVQSPQGNKIQPRNRIAAARPRPRFVRRLGC
uniref:Uncharacterized protein n=1 Tax=Arundo donax TaxID=35708 RepID=A0A0A9EC11_ARUDO